MDLETVSATEFKAKCLDLLNQVGARQIERLEITKRGKVVAVLIPPARQADAVQHLHGFLRGSVVIPGSVDLTASSLDDPLDAARGELHR
jgi:prevent-host-death family protein